MEEYFPSYKKKNEIKILIKWRKNLSRDITVWMNITALQDSVPQNLPVLD